MREASKRSGEHTPTSVRCITLIVANVEDELPVDLKDDESIVAVEHHPRGMPDYGYTVWVWVSR